MLFTSQKKPINIYVDGDTVLVLKLDGTTAKYITRPDGLSGSIYVSSESSEGVDDVKNFLNGRLINPSQNYWK